MDKHGSTGQAQLPFLVDLWNILFRCCIMLLIERIVSRDGESTILRERIFDRRSMLFCVSLGVSAPLYSPHHTHILEAFLS